MKIGEGAFIYHAALCRMGDSRLLGSLNQGIESEVLFEVFSFQFSAKGRSGRELAEN